MVERTILLGTSNRAKRRKLAWMLDGLEYVIATPDDYAPVQEPEEQGATHREIAGSKARFWSVHAAGLAIATDGGARIAALGDDWDSLLTRRAAGPTATDEERAEYMLASMRGRKGGDREVVWVEAVALALRGELLASWQAQGALGRLVTRCDSDAIAGGFWLAGLVLVPRFNKLYTRLTPEEVALVDDGWNELRPRVRALLEKLPAL